MTQAPPKGPTSYTINFGGLEFQNINFVENEIVRPLQAPFPFFSFLGPCSPKGFSIANCSCVLTYALCPSPSLRGQMKVFWFWQPGGPWRD